MKNGLLDGALAVKSASVSEEVELVKPKKRRGGWKHSKLPDTGLTPEMMREAMKAAAGSMGAVEQVAALEAKVAGLTRAQAAMLTKMRKNPNPSQDAVERAIAYAGEHPLMSLMKMAHEKDASGQYVLDAKERRLILSEVAAYATAKQRATEVKTVNDYEFNITVKQYAKPKPAEVVDVKAVEDAKEAVDA